jgi:CPA2 family monovalent cation:H+ antiporter-2
MQIDMFTDILLVFGLSVVILLISHRAGLPAVVGLLLTGVVAGPHGLGLVHATHEVEALAELGVVLLLFTIGIEFSLARLFQIKRLVLMGGMLQVALCTGAAFLLARLAGLPTGAAVFIGFIMSLSSTAIVLKSIQGASGIDSPQGQSSLAILIFQDIIVVPMMLLIPLLAGASDDPLEAIGILVAKGIGVMALALVGTKFIVPWLLHQIARTRSRELFVLCIVVLCLGIAWLTSSIGLSLGLGAFLAGLIISESEYSHYALGGILPFRDVFTSLFFVSIGMLLDIGFVIEHAVTTLGILLLVLVVKSLVITLVVLLLGYPIRTAVMVGLALSQIGEFAFVLVNAGNQYNLLSPELYQTFLATSVLSMAATPLIISASPSLADLAAKLPLPKRVADRSIPHETAGAGGEKLKDHIIIVGYGINGRSVARAARAAGIPYIAIDVNADAVRREQKKGERIVFGDASYDAVLEHAGIEEAKVLALVINDPIAARSIIQTARRLRPDLHIIVRTRYVRDINPLIHQGADEVIPEEFETSIDIFTSVLARYSVPEPEIENLVATARRDGYALFTSAALRESMPIEVVFRRPGAELETLTVEKGSPLAGRSLAEIDIRRKYGVTLLEIDKGDEVLVNPGGDVRLAAGNTMVVMGPAEGRARLARACSHGGGRQK